MASPRSDGPNLSLNVTLSHTNVTFLFCVRSCLPHSGRFRCCAAITVYHLTYFSVGIVVVVMVVVGAVGLVVVGYVGLLVVGLLE